MKKIALLTLVLVFAISCSGDSSDTKDPVFNAEGIALDGYDPVAYFEQGEARVGVESEQVEYEGLTYYFSSTKNRSLFLKNPEQYLPKYGGWCAYAVAESATKMEPDLTQWQIQDGELILFTSNIMTKLTGSLKDDWNEDPDGYMDRADTNWSSMNK
ncbi:MAG: YHS domain-containing protein [Ekhidna sp.]|nr:YHS domain-containing protein [Ekhidna sp.]